jgi:glycerophosphoryl diester phosphodiesterase
MKKDILQIAHRGNSRYYKDNTKQAITSALIEGFSMIEIDIQVCKTGEIIVFHDTYIKDKMIENITYSELVKCRNDILKLEEVFDISGISNMKIYLDLKGSLSLVRAIVNFLKTKIPMINLDNIYIASFNIEHIEQLHNYLPNISYGFITGNNFDSIIYHSIIRRKYIKFFCICWTMLNNKTCSMLHDMSIKIFTFTCENDTILKEMLRYNIDGIVTNYKLILY